MALASSCEYREDLLGGISVERRSSAESGVTPTFSITNPSWVVEPQSPAASILLITFSPAPQKSKLSIRNPFYAGASERVTLTAFQISMEIPH